jgi:hypothetical protein
MKRDFNMNCYVGIVRFNTLLTACSWLPPTSSCSTAEVVDWKSEVEHDAHFRHHVSCFFLRLRETSKCIC